MAPNSTGANRGKRERNLCSLPLNSWGGVVERDLNLANPESFRSSGPTLGAMPTSPALGAAPPLVAPNIFGRIAALAGRIKKHPGYTKAIGQDLGLSGADIALDVTAIKPILDVTLKAAHPNIGWTKQGLDGLPRKLSGLVDRGTGSFGFLAFDTIPDYLDTAALPAPGLSAVWK